MGAPLDDAQRRLAAIQASLGPRPGRPLAPRPAPPPALPVPRPPGRPPARTLAWWAWTLAAALLSAAAVIHFVLAPEHMAHAQGQGLFFIALGVVQLGSGLAALRQDSLLPLRAGFVASLASIGVYVVTRVARQPFGTTAEDVDTTGMATKLIELAALAACALALARGDAALRPARPAAAVAVLVAAGLVAAAALYGLGLVLEDAVPVLGEGSQHTHHAEGHAHAQQGGAGGLAQGSVPAGRPLRAGWAR